MGRITLPLWFVDSACHNGDHLQGALWPVTGVEFGGSCFPDDIGVVHRALSNAWYLEKALHIPSLPPPHSRHLADNLKIFPFCHLFVSSALPERVTADPPERH